MAKKKKQPGAALTKITARAKQLRKAKPGMKWLTAVKQAGADYRNGKIGCPAPPAIARVGKVKKSATRQTGSSNKKKDKQRTAKPPGKRIVRHRGGKNTSYTERRKNRSDKPGQLTGISTPMLQNVVRKRLEDDLGKALVRKKLATNYKTHKAASDKVNEINKQLKQFYY